MIKGFLAFVRSGDTGSSAGDAFGMLCKFAVFSFSMASIATLYNRIVGFSLK